MNKKVLIVEDDAFILDTVTRKFETAGYKVSPAKNAEEAKKYMLSDMPNVILLDIMLPQVNGIEFLKQIRAEESTKNIPVVVFSNLGSETEIKQAMDIGATEYLVKASFTPSEVIEKVNKLLAK